MLDLQKLYGNLTDKEYLDRVLSIIASSQSAEDFPSFPPDSVQASYVGSSNEGALIAAFDFYHHVKNTLAQIGLTLEPDDKFLDFGCGWGRLIRFFGRDFRPENIFGVDIDKDILQTCRATRVPGQFLHLEQFGKLPFADGAITLAVAYSVFTHLPEDVHLYWMKELARVMAPRGVVALTLEPRRFLDFVSTLAEREAQTPWHKVMALFAVDANQNKSRFDAGEFVYLATGGGAYRPAEVYGEAIVPPSYIQAHWSDDFEIVEYLDDPKRFFQAVLIVRRKA